MRAEALGGGRSAVRRGNSWQAAERPASPADTTADRSPQARHSRGTAAATDAHAPPNQGKPDRPGLVVEVTDTRPYSASRLRPARPAAGRRSHPQTRPRRLLSTVVPPSPGVGGVTAHPPELPGPQRPPPSASAGARRPAHPGHPARRCPSSQAPGLAGTATATATATATRPADLGPRSCAAPTAGPMPRPSPGGTVAACRHPRPPTRSRRGSRAAAAAVRRTPAWPVSRRSAVPCWR